MKPIGAFLLVSSFSMLSLSAMAQNKASPINDPSSFQGRETWERTHRASKIIGTDVRNPQGEDLGDIKELVLDSSGNIAYAVISLGGVMGVGDKLYAVPWKAFRLDSAKNNYVLDVDKERLKGAPAFDAARWPDMANTQWNNDVHTYYGQRYESGRTGSLPR